MGQDRAKGRNQRVRARGKAGARRGKIKKRTERKRRTEKAAMRKSVPRVSGIWKVEE